MRYIRSCVTGTRDIALQRQKNDKNSRKRKKYTQRPVFWIFERPYYVLTPSEWVRLTVVRRDVEGGDCVVLRDASIHAARCASGRFRRRTAFFSFLLRPRSWQRMGNIHSPEGSTAQNTFYSIRDGDGHHGVYARVRLCALQITEPRGPGHHVWDCPLGPTYQLHPSR